MCELQFVPVVCLLLGLFSFSVLRLLLHANERRTMDGSERVFFAPSILLCYSNIYSMLRSLLGLPLENGSSWSLSLPPSIHCPTRKACLRHRTYQTKLNEGFSIHIVIRYSDRQDKANEKRFQLLFLLAMHPYPGRA